MQEGADPVQLAVENDRAVFILYDEHLGSSLWLLNLRSPHDWDDPCSQLPQPVSPALPSSCPARTQVSTHSVGSLASNSRRSASHTHSRPSARLLASR